ncbi:MAG: hypothetical protein RLZZ338_1797 [Cyanobacteriota bacterium]|jgi:hypothetical protein
MMMGKKSSAGILPASLQAYAFRPKKPGFLLNLRDETKYFRKTIPSPFVGWVERSETQQP